MNTNNELSSSFNLGIRGKLLLGFMILILISSISIIWTLYLLVPTKEFASQVINGTLPSYTAINELEKTIYQTQSEMRGYMLFSKPESKANVQNGLKEMLTEMSEIDASLAKEEVKALSDSWIIAKDLLAKRNQTYQTILDMTDIEAAKTLLETTGQVLTYKALDVLDGELDGSGVRNGGMDDKLSTMLDNGSTKILQDMNSIQNIEILFLVLTVVISILIALTTAHLIIPPLTRGISFAKRIAAGVNAILIFKVTLMMKQVPY